MFRRISKIGGYIALMTVLIISALLLTLLSSAQLIGTSNLAATLVERIGTETHFLADSCFEDTLLKLRGSELYSGENNLPVLDGFCDITVVNTGGDEYQITVEANALNSYYKILAATINIITTADTKKIAINTKTYY